MGNKQHMVLPLSMYGTIWLQHRNTSSVKIREIHGFKSREGCSPTARSQHLTLAAIVLHVPDSNGFGVTRTRNFPQYIACRANITTTGRTPRMTRCCHSFLKRSANYANLREFLCILCEMTIPKAKGMPDYNGLNTIKTASGRVASVQHQDRVA